MYPRNNFEVFALALPTEQQYQHVGCAKFDCLINFETFDELIWLLVPVCRSVWVDFASWYARGPNSIFNQNKVFNVRRTVVLA